MQKDIQQTQREAKEKDKEKDKERPKQRMEIAREMLDKYVAKEYASRGINRAYKNPLHEEIIKKSVAHVIRKEVPVFRRIPEKFESKETQKAMKGVSDRFFEDLNDGKIAVTYDKYFSEDFKFLIEQIYIVNNENGKITMVSQNAQKVVPGTA